MKNKNFISLLIALFSLLGVTSLYAQQDNTLYFMRSIPQSNLPNPAAGFECKVNVWGILVPVFGQLPPPVSLNLGNNGFTYKHLFKKGGIYYLTPDTNPSYPRIKRDLSDSLVFDKDYILDALAPKNFLTADLQIHLLGFGIKIDKWYFTAGITEKLNFSLAYPKDLIGLFLKGNAAYLDEPADLSGLGLNFLHYREFSLGAQTQIIDKLKVGGNLKFLFGKSNIYTRKSEMKLYTDPDNSYALRMTTDFEISASIPDPFTIEYNDGTQPDGRVYADSMKLEGNFEIDDVGKFASGYMTNKKNLGLALDLGAIYELNKEIELSASIIDLGFIRWKSNTYTFKSNGEFTYQGINFPEYADTVHNDATELAEQLVDSVYRAFMLKSHNDAYNSYLPTKIYLGGTYKINDMMNVGLLTRTAIFHRRLHPSVTLSCNANITKWLQASASYSFINRYYMNLGLGFGIKASFMQFYVVSDNLFGIRPEASTGALLPYNTRNMNIRFGCNLIFGCGKSVTKSYL